MFWVFYFDSYESSHTIVAVKSHRFEALPIHLLKRHGSKELHDTALPLWHNFLKFSASTLIGLS